MKRSKVSSSLIASFAYDKATGVFEIEFQNGMVYRYFDVRPEDHIGFLRAPSKGQFFQTRIDPVYRHECIDPERIRGR